MPTLRDRGRNLRNRWIDQNLQLLDGAVRQMGRGEGEILLLGDSSCLSWAYSDTDRTLLPQMLAERTGASVVTLAAGGFNARVYDQFLRILEALDHRPRAVVACLAIRTNTALHVREHPMHGHLRTLAALARIHPPVSRVRSFGRGGVVLSRREVARFRARTVTTRWGGTKTIGEHLVKIEGTGLPPWPDDVTRARFDYFHGEAVTPDNPGLPELTAFGRRLVQYGVPAVACWSQVPLRVGEELWPGEFAPAIHADLALVEQALVSGAPQLGGLLRPALEDEDFQDYRNGIEHYSHSGRVKVTDAITEALSRLGV